MTHMFNQHPKLIRQYFLDKTNVAHFTRLPFQFASVDQLFLRDKYMHQLKLAEHRKNR